MTKIIHPIAGTLALLTILSFWLATALSELFADQGVVTAVKTAIPWGFVILVPALMAVGGSGFRLGRQRRGPLERFLLCGMQAGRQSGPVRRPHHVHSLQAPLAFWFGLSVRGECLRGDG